MTRRLRWRLLLSFCVTIGLGSGGCAGRQGGDPPSSATPSEGTAPVEEDASARDSIAWPEGVWPAFVQDFNTHDPERLEVWSAPQGLLLLDNPGAFVQVRLLPSAPDLLRMEGGYDGARVQHLSFQKSIDAGPIPEVDCGKTPEITPGTFRQKTDGAFLLPFIDALEKYQLKSAEEVAPIRAAYERSSTGELLSVADTRQSVRFLFQKTDSHPLLVAVFAVVPCSA